MKRINLRNLSIEYPVLRDAIRENARKLGYRVILREYTPANPRDSKVSNFLLESLLPAGEIEVKTEENFVASVRLKGFPFYGTALPYELKRFIKKCLR